MKYLLWLISTAVDTIHERVRIVLDGNLPNGEIDDAKQNLREISEDLLNIIEALEEIKEAIQK